MAKAEKTGEHDCHATSTDDQQNPNRVPGQAEAAAEALAADEAAAAQAEAAGETPAESE